MKKTRILIADDHDVVRSGLKMLLRSHAGFSIVAEAADGEEAIRLTDKHHPDIAILDISMPKMDGIEATKIIKEHHPDVKVLILSVHENEEYAYQVLRAGASGYVLKNSGKKEIFDAVRSALSGERFFSPGISKIIVDGFVSRSEAATGPGERKSQRSGSKQDLTDREIEILRFIAQGFTNRQIADQLCLSFRTVNTHRANLMQKLDIHETAGLVRYAINAGLIKLEA
jgi:DNA-binding NarL/FixJ family response regulator